MPYVLCIPLKPIYIVYTVASIYTPSIKSHKLQTNQIKVSVKVAGKDSQGLILVKMKGIKEGLSLQLFYDVQNIISL